MVNSCAPKLRWDHSGSRGFARALIKVAVFIRGSVGSFGLELVHYGAPRDRRHVRAWVQYRAPRGRRVHSGSRGFTRARLVVVVFIRVRVGLLGRA